MDCLFCKINRKEIPAKIVYEDSEILAFHDIAPKAPVHILIIPKQHIATVNDLATNHAEMVGKLVLTAKRLAAEHQLSDRGYRLVLNCNEDAGQAVFHIHLHLLGGRQMTWPPG